MAKQQILPLAAFLAVASLALWFFLGFPWQMHNESLIWDIKLRHATWWDALFSNPVPTVQTYRPLGMIFAWLTFHMTGGGVWLQQLCNFVITAGAWILALRASRNQLPFAFVTFICLAAFFSGYIYLFHLHGVFYGPLLWYLAYLVVEAQSDAASNWIQALKWLAIGTVFALFHPFALLMLVAFVAARCVQDLRDRKSAALGASALVVVAALLEIKLLTRGSSDISRGGLLAGLLSSYRGLEFNRGLAVLSIALTAAVLTSLTSVNSRRLLWTALAVAAGIALVLAQQPVIIAWIIACVGVALFRRRLVMAALVAVCAVLPAATGTGTPTYAVFVIMPCIAITVQDFQWKPNWQPVAARLAIVIIAVTGVLWIALRAEWQIPIVTHLVRPLYAEREKTYQLADVFTWLDQHPQQSGSLRLCHPAEFPVLSSGAVDRLFRAPSDEWAFDNYLQSRYGERFQGASPQFVLCFGGEQVPGGKSMVAIPGKWAGTASIEQLNPAAL